MVAPGVVVARVTLTDPVNDPAGGVDVGVATVGVPPTSSNAPIEGLEGRELPL